MEDDSHEGREAQGDIGRGWGQPIDEVIESQNRSDQERVFGWHWIFIIETSLMVWRASAVAVDRLAGRLHPPGGPPSRLRDGVGQRAAAKRRSFSLLALGHAVASAISSRGSSRRFRKSDAIPGTPSISWAGASDRFTGWPYAEVSPWLENETSS